MIVIIKTKKVLTMDINSQQWWKEGCGGIDEIIILYMMVTVMFNRLGNDHTMITIINDNDGGVVTYNEIVRTNGDSHKHHTSSMAMVIVVTLAMITVEVEMKNKSQAYKL